MIVHGSRRTPEERLHCLVYPSEEVRSKPTSPGSGLSGRTGIRWLWEAFAPMLILLCAPDGPAADASGIEILTRGYSEAGWKVRERA
ncbi:hypothetical protein M407DRAFT_245304 [Tulasnella calospora MUT 4182]|uniref:Uncharacterized protein n=1 Tax=Tulasnella calospora MUT 4182 TaxID=1051891 RepID=A0A0C3Q1G9_9AGAM|nr:hypothetical protein M407DRAFT_245304 [Tulasnella calospora MUT 4182]